MSKSTTMLRTRRRDNNVKPNRRLDRKSSRGMIYENEELRLRTININAEVERGQSDIKKLRRENDMLKKEIWCLRDGYDKLEKLIKEKGIDSSSSSSTCSSSDSESSCSSCTEDHQGAEVETSQNLENVQKTNLKNLHTQFNHLSVVPEENSTENSEKNSNRASLPNDAWLTTLDSDIIKPDQSYPLNNVGLAPKNFFSPISRSYDDCINNEFSTNEHFPDYRQTAQHFYQQNLVLKPSPVQKSTTDLIVKMDNRNFSNQAPTPSQSTFSNGGNLEELLNDIETISRDILKISSVYPVPVVDSGDIMSQIQHGETGYVQNARVDNLEFPEGDNGDDQRPYKSELNVVLMPNPMPLIGFDKYRNLQKSCESLDSRSLENMSASCQNLRVIPESIEHARMASFLPPAGPEILVQNNSRSPFLVPENRVPLDSLPVATMEASNPFFFGTMNDFSSRYNPENFTEQEEKIEKPKNEEPPEEKREIEIEVVKKEEDKKGVKSPKMSIRRKVSIHFKGKKDKSKVPPAVKEKRAPEKNKAKKVTTALMESESKTATSGAESKSSSAELKSVEVKTDRTMSLPNYTTKLPDPKILEKKVRKSTSVSPDRKHVHMKDEKKCHKKHKRSRARRSSLSTDRILRERSFSVCTDRSNILDHRLGLGFGSSYLYDDCNSDSRSLSSCDTTKTRKMSNISNLPLGGKIPWCGCWGNGCL